MRWTETYKLLEPFFLLVVTAILTTYVAPKITQRWQNHQKALELKTSLVGDINENVLQMLMAIQFAEVGAASQTQEEFDQAYSAWEVKRAIIGATLRSYFPQTHIGREWDDFSDVVSDFYALTGISDPHVRQKQVNGLKEYFEEYFVKNDLSWEALANVELRQSRRSQEYAQAWDSLRKLIRERKDTLVQEILAAQIRFFSS